MTKEELGTFIDERLESGDWDLPVGPTVEEYVKEQVEHFFKTLPEIEGAKPGELEHGTGEQRSETPYTDIARYGYAVQRGNQRMLDDMKKKDHLIGTDSQGGYLAPTTSDNELINLTIRDSVMMGISKVKQSPTNVLTFPTLTQTGGINGYWVAESTDADGGSTKTTEETLVFGQVTITLYALRANAIVTNEALEDTTDFGTDIEKTITEDIREGLAAGVDFGVIHGNETAGEGNANSLLNGLENLITTNTYNTEGAFNYSHMVKLMTPEDNSRGALAYVMAPAARRQLIDMKDGNDRPIFESGLATGSIPSVLGSPIHLNRNVSKTLGAGTETAIFSGTFGSDCLIGVKRGVSILVNPYRFADYAATQITAFMRVGFTVTAQNRFAILGGVPTE